MVMYAPLNTTVHSEDIEKVLRRHQIKHGIRDMKSHCTCGWVGEAGDKRSPHIAEDILTTLLRLQELRRVCDACALGYDDHPDVHPEGCLCDFNGQRRSFMGGIVPIVNRGCPLHGESDPFRN